MDQSTLLFHVLHGIVGIVLGTCVPVVALTIAEITVTSRRTHVVIVALCAAVLVVAARTAAHYPVGFLAAAVAACCILCGILWDALGNK